MKTLNRFLAIGALVAVLFPAHSLRADAFVYHFGDVFSGDSPVSLNRPWSDALFQDVTPGTVRLTISNLALTRRESVKDMFFNLNPNLHPENLQFSFVSGVGRFDLPAISKGINLFRADDDSLYDLKFSFASGGTVNRRFGARESLVMDISGISGLQAMDFASLSSPTCDTGPFYAAAHIQRIGRDASGSGWIVPIGNQVSIIPEPSSALLGFLGLAACLARRLAKGN
jgi:hypothetical protein